MQQIDIPLTASIHVARGIRAMALPGAAAFVVSLRYAATLPTSAHLSIAAAVLRCSAVPRPWGFLPDPPWE